MGILFEKQNKINMHHPICTHPVRFKKKNENVSTRVGRNPASSYEKKHCQERRDHDVTVINPPTCQIDDDNLV